LETTACVNFVPQQLTRSNRYSPQSSLGGYSAAVQVAARLPNRGEAIEV